jgi:hypothetical protein
MLALKAISAARDFLVNGRLATGLQPARTLSAKIWLLKFDRRVLEVAMRKFVMNL